MSENLPTKPPKRDPTYISGKPSEDIPPEVPPAKDQDRSSRNMAVIIATVAILFICAIVAVVLLVVRPFTAEPTPIPTTAPEGLVDPIWANIQASDKLVVGTSADYPPFEYYTDDFQLDGFDIALIKAVGQRLGLTVELKDMAFDGLGGALQINQIDVAISAITVSPEREAFIDFTNTYFLSEDALLAVADREIPINAINDIGAYRLGVQSGSIYEAFARTQLIETGQMPSANLFVYPQMINALDDLTNGRIDLVALDSAPANVAVQQGGFQIAASGLTPQLIAMAIPQDSFTLKSELNRVLAELQADGTVNQLIEQYFNIDSDLLPPIPTPDPGQPTPTPAPPSGCIDAMQWVSDLNLNDQNFTDIQPVPAGNAFQKGWRLRNTGTCTWNDQYAIAPVGSNSAAANMGGLPTPVQGQIAPGQTYDFWVNLTAPLDPGTYVEYWTMRNPQGVLFGDRVWVAIEVPGSPTPTPPPTQTPSPSITFVANPEAIQEGQCSTLTWSTSNVQAVYLYRQGDPWQNNGVPGSGSRSVCPSETTTYELRVLKNDGSIEIRSTTVFVTPNPGAPNITRFTVEPPYEITLGQCVLITWAVEGTVDNVTLSRDAVIIYPNAPYSGSMQDCPPSAGDVRYAIDATGPGGNSRLQHYLRVNVPAPTATPPPAASPTPPATATLVPTPTRIPDPIIYSFSVTPNQVQTGQCVTLAWHVGGNTSQIQILKNGQVVLADAAFNDTVQDCNLTTAGKVSYDLQATNNSGGSAAAQQQVSVVAGIPDNPLANSQWQLVSYLTGELQTPVIDQSIVSLTFQSNGEYAGSGGCNTYGGHYQVNGNQIALSDFIKTQKLCGPELDQQEAAYFSLLPQATTFQVDPQNQLILSNESGQVILVYKVLVVVTPF